MSNPTIKSIQVCQRFEIGEVWYLGENGYPEVFRIHSKPYWAPNLPGGHYGTNWIELLSEFGTVYKRSCGDLGINGFKYDNRPCTLVRTYEACQLAIGKYEDWFWAQDDCIPNY